MKDYRTVEGKKGKGPRVSRRTFLKASALAGLTLGVGGCGRESGPLPQPPIKAASPEAREKKWVSSSCLNCPSRCGIRVKVVNGRAVQIVGNEWSLVSEGKICPRGHIGLQVLYDQERIFSPLKRTRLEKGAKIDPKWQPISWNEALDEISIRLKSIRDRQHPHRVLLFSGLNSRSAQDLLQRFANAFGTPNLVSGDGLDQETEKSGNWMADGHYAACAFDLDRTNYILSFGCDLLESSQPVSRFLRKWGRLRREKPNRTKVVMIQPRYSLTAAKSDEWIPISPGTDAALALGLAHLIIKEGLYDEPFVKEWTSGFDQYKRLVLEHYPPETVSKTTDIAAETIHRIAREFAQTKPALALRGKGAIDWPDGSYISYAIHCLNALVGSIDAPGGVLYQEEPRYQDMPKWSPDEIASQGLKQPPLDFHASERFPIARVVTNQIPESLWKGLLYPVEMAIGFHSNFNMTAPGSGQWNEALKKIPYYIHVSPFLSEMAQFADLVLPSTVFLEEWGYDHSPPGSGFAEMRIKQPVVKPKGEAKSVLDILFLLADRLGGEISKSLSSMGGDAEGFVRFRTASLLPWDEFLSKGVWTGQPYQYRKYHKLFQTPSKKFEFFSGNLRQVEAKIRTVREEEHPYVPRFKEAKFLGDEVHFPWILFPYQPLLVIENGSQNYPWAQEIFLPMQGVGWAALAEINAETGRKLNLRDQDEVWIESPFGKIKTRIKLSERVHPKIVSIPWGQGHTSYGKWQKDIGCNPNEVIGVNFDQLSGQAAFFNTRVKVYKA